MQGTLIAPQLQGLEFQILKKIEFLEKFFENRKKGISQNSKTTRI